LKLLFIGAINSNNLPNGGEEYKNQLLLSKINETFGEKIVIDTYRWLKRPWVLWSLVITILFRNAHVVLISASSVSTYRLIKLINLIRPSLIEKTTYLVIGGYFPEGIQTERFSWKFYKNLKNVIVEGESLKRNLQVHSGLTNIKVISNFKTFPNFSLCKNHNTGSLFRFVFVGRISEGKGIKEILEAVDILSQKDNPLEVDFYGPMEEKFVLETDKSNHCGFLDFQYNPIIAYSQLSEYDCMLFPTYWIGEGFPGVIIDAFVVGLPVIATDWNMNTEIIKDGVNGFIIEPKSSKALAERMEYVMQNRAELVKIRENNRARAKDYHIDKIWPQILELL
jgi:glycosyltransferase involved in cell wall biosynthesis